MHAVLAITGPTSAYSGQVDLLWFSATQYRLTLSFPTFHQLRMRNGDQLQERNDGDFDPRWLQTFAEALLDPASLLSNFRGRSSQIHLDPISPAPACAATTAPAASPTSSPGAFSASLVPSPALHPSSP